MFVTIQTLSDWPAWTDVRMRGCCWMQLWLRRLHHSHTNLQDIVLMLQCGCLSSREHRGGCTVWWSGVSGYQHRGRWSVSASCCAVCAACRLSSRLQMTAVLPLVFLPVEQDPVVGGKPPRSPILSRRSYLSPVRGRRVGGPSLHSAMLWLCSCLRKEFLLMHSHCVTCMEQQCSVPARSVSAESSPQRPVGSSPHVCPQWSRIHLWQWNILTFHPKKQQSCHSSKLEEEPHKQHVWLLVCFCFSSQRMVQDALQGGGDP